MQLPDTDRAEVAARLLESLDSGQDADAPEQWEQEVRRRLEELDRGDVKTIPWSEARAIIRGERDVPPVG